MRFHAPFRPFSSLFFAAAAALGAAALTPVHVDGAIITIKQFESKTPADLAGAGWDGNLSTLRFSGTIPPAVSISSIFSALLITEDATFAAGAGTSEQRLFIGPSQSDGAAVSGAVRITAGKNVVVSGNNDSAILIAAGSALHVGPVNSTAGTGGLTITENSSAHGGGLRILGPDGAEGTGSLARLENVVFSKNTAEARVPEGAGAGAPQEGGLGGAVFAVQPGLLELLNTRFTENTAVHGGAVYGRGGTLSFHSTVEFAKNTANGTGGAIHVDSGASLTLAAVKFTENTAANGGALHMAGSGTTGVISGTGFTGNAASGSPGETPSGGGAIHLVDTAALQLATSTFTGNTSAAAGGALFLEGATLTAATRASSDDPSKELGNTFTRNTAATAGGAVYATNGSGLALTDATFTQNTAATGGAAIHLENSSNARLIVSAAKTVLFTGNTTGADPSTSIPNSIHINTGMARTAGDTATSSLEFVATATGTFDLRDPMSGHAGLAAVGETPALKGVINISKLGEGELVLHGASRFTQQAGTDSSVKFDLAAGKLHLASAGAYNATIDNESAEAPAGGLHLGPSSTFTISGDATLSIAGGNTIEAGTITLYRTGKLLFDLGNVAEPAASAAMLTLAGGAEKVLLDATTLVLSNFANIADGTHRLVDASATTAAIDEAGFHAPETLVLDGVEGARGIRGVDGIARMLTLGASVEDRTLSLIVETTGELADAAALTWTGKAGDVWGHASSAANWSGKTSDGLVATTFRDGDSVTFGDSPFDPNVPTAPRNVQIDGTVRPASVSLNNNQTPLVFSGGRIESDGSLTLSTPVGLSLKDTTASFAEGIVVNNTGSTSGEHPLTLDNAVLSTSGKAEFHGALFLGRQPESGDETPAPAVPESTGRLEARDIEIHGYVMGDGTLAAGGTILNKGTIAAGHNGKRGTISLAGPLENEGTIRVKYLSDLTYDRLRNIGEADIVIGGTILYYVDSKWLENNNEILPGFLERDATAGTIRISGDATLAFVDPTMKGTLVDAATGSVRISRQYNLANVHDGLGQFVNELATRAWQGNAYAAYLLGMTEGSTGYDPVSIAAASPIGFGAMPALLNRAANDSTQSLREHLESRFSYRLGAEKRGDAEGRPGAGATPDFHVRGTGNIARNGTGASDPFFNHNSGSVIIGLDSQFGDVRGGKGPSMLLGASLGGHFGQADFHHGAGKVNLSQYRGTFYGSLGMAKATGDETIGLNLLGSLSGGVSRFDTQRETLGLRNSGDADAQDFGTSLHLTGVSTFHALSLQPYVGAEYHYNFVGSFREQGALPEGVLRINSLEQQSLQLQTGLKIAGDLSNILPARPRLVLDLGYSHEFCDVEAGLRARLANANGAARFVVRSKYASRDLFHAGPSMEISSDWSTLSIGYRYETDFSAQTNHSLHAEFRIRF
jgi:predicted outer membrane repeat protein